MNQSSGQTVQSRTETERSGIAPPNYRLPEATRLGRVTLQVADLERSLRYYERVLGLEALNRSASAASLGPKGGERVLIELRERPGARPVPPRGRLGLYHFAMLLPDRAALGSFVRHLAEQGIAAGMSDHAVSEAVYLGDPDGLGIEVYADRPRRSWRSHEGEIHMTTEPLDAAALVRAAGDGRWSGMPSDTVLGHVHLFVDDLARAAAFFHEGLGLDKTVWSYRGALFLAAGGYHHHLGTNTWAAGAPRASADDARLLEWEIVLPGRSDIEAAARSLEVARHAVSAEGNGLTAVDPWGTRVRLSAMQS